MRTRNKPPQSLKEREKKTKKENEEREMVTIRNSEHQQFGKIAVASVVLFSLLSVFFKTEQKLFTLSLLSLVVMMAFFAFCSENSNFSDELATQLTTLPIFLIPFFAKPFGSYYRARNIII